MSIREFRHGITFWASEDKRFSQFARIYARLSDHCRGPCDRGLYHHGPCYLVPYHCGAYHRGSSYWDRPCRSTHFCREVTTIHGGYFKLVELIKHVHGCFCVAFEERIGDSIVLRFIKLFMRLFGCVFWRWHLTENSFDQRFGLCARRFNHMFRWVAFRWPSVFEMPSVTSIALANNVLMCIIR